MRIDRNEDGSIQAIVLSKRNLESLLEKLAWNSKRTIGFPEWEETEIVIRAEPDEIHYANRPAPGLMVNSKKEIY